MIPGRNDPCPYGSGRKYKKCHGASAIVPHEESVPGALEAMAAQKLDHDLVERMMRFSHARYGKEWYNAALGAYRDFNDTDFDGTDAKGAEVDETELQLALPWAFHSFAWGPTQESLAEHFRREQGRHLPPGARAARRAVAGVVLVLARRRGGSGRRTRPASSTSATSATSRSSSACTRTRRRCCRRTR